MSTISCSLPALRKLQVARLAILSTRNFSENFYKSVTATAEPRERLKHVNCNQSAIDLAAAKKSGRLKPSTILYSGKSSNDSHILRTAEYLQRELPIRIAHRIVAIQGLPYNVVTNPTILQVLEMYIHAFEVLTEFPPIQNMSDEAKYAELLRNLLEQHRDVVTMLAEGFSECRKNIKEEDTIRVFLDRTLKSRLGIRILCEHHLALRNQKTKDREFDFDVETAIKVCRQAGYYKHALFLANKHHLHEWYLKIQLDDIKDYGKALEYIGRLEFGEAEESVKKYGKILMAERPEQTTGLLKRLCTDYKPTDKPLVDAGEMEGTTITTIERAQAEQFIHIFVNNSAKLTEFLEHMTLLSSSSPSLMYNTLLELYLHDIAHLESVEARALKHKKILELLRNPDANYDLDQALVLCQMNNFKDGILYLYEKARLYQQIMRYHMDNDAYDLVIQTCKNFGKQDPNLWVQALSYFAKKENLKQQLGVVLHNIDKQNLLPPLLVIQTLAHSSTATLSVIKNYVIRKLQGENDQIAEDERLIKQYKEDTKKKRQQIEELKTTAKIFQNTKCSICNHPLELPSVHFLCEPHSFHQHCFENYADNENECPVCMPENRKILDIIQAQQHGRDLHETFHNQLERAQDGFSVVADYFGRGVFNKVTLITDSPARMANLPGKYP